MNYKTSYPKTRLEIATETVIDSDGKEYVSFRPVLIPDCCACGRVSFAVFQVAATDTHLFAKAQSDALANARKVIAEWATL